MLASASPSILIVEDDALIRLLISEMLGDLGCVTHEAATAAEALTVAVADHPISAAVLDFGLPDRPGNVLASEIRAHRPDLPIMVVSGRQPSEIANLLQITDRIEILQKPFTETDLKTALQRLQVVS